MRLVEQREELEGGNVPLRLPGVQKGDMAARRFKPEVQVFGVRFSPTGQSFAAACTEGLCLFSLDKGRFNLYFAITLINPISINQIYYFFLQFRRCV